MGFALECNGLARTAMKFTVTSKVGVNEVVDRSNSARAALEQVLVLLGRKRNDVRIFDEDGSRRTPAELWPLRLALGLTGYASTRRRLRPPFLL